MKIKIIREIPVDPDCQPKVDKIYEAKKVQVHKRRMYEVNINGEGVRCYPYEVEVISDT